MPTVKPRRRRRRKRRKPAFNTGFSQFQRRKLPYHLVMRCRRRKGNRPSRLFGPSRAELLCIRREKRRRYRYNKAKRRPLQAWEEATSGQQAPCFRLYEPDEDCLNRLVRTIGPGGTPLNADCGDQVDFELETSTPHSIIDTTPLSTQELSIWIGRAMEYGRAYSSVPMGDVMTMPICYDTGASGGITPFKSDFIHYYKMETNVQGVGGNAKVVGAGITLTKMTCRDRSVVYVPEFKYHMPTCKIRLSSPQNTVGEEGLVSLRGKHIEWRLPDRRIIDIPIDTQTNLPLIRGGFVCSSEEKEKFGPKFLQTIIKAPQDKHIPLCQLTSVQLETNEEEIAGRCCQCVTDTGNENLSSPKKELLHWHHKLCMNMLDLQNLMKPIPIRNKAGVIVGHTSAVIPTKFASTKNLKPSDFPVCQACKLATAKARSPGVKTGKPVDGKEGLLSRDKYEPGDMISTDQYIVKTPGRLFTGYGREAQHNSFHGGTIYQDAASNLVRCNNQISMGAGETVQGKVAFEEWIWNLAGVLAKQYHSDNGIFASELFKDDCSQKKQKQTFSGVGAQHQNARAERTIQTVSYWARSMMVHAALHWPSDGANNIRLWAFAINHAAWLYNRLPNKYLGYQSPLEVFTKSKSDHRDLLRTHVWGCPVFVLEAKLQDGHKIPKFNRRARMGQFLGFSDEHSTLVAQVRHLHTNHVSPQYHVVYDDKFSCIYNEARRDDTKLEAIFTELFESCRDYYGEDAISVLERMKTPNQVTIPTDALDIPEVGNEWLTESEIRDKRDRVERRISKQNEFRQKQAKEFERLNSNYKPPYPTPELKEISDDESSDSDSSDDEGSIGGSVDFGDSGGDHPDGPFGGAGTEVQQQPEIGPQRRIRQVLRRSRVNDTSPDEPRRPERLRRGGRVRKPFNRHELKSATRHLNRHVNFAESDLHFADDSYMGDMKKHPEFGRCYTSLVTDRMRDDDYIMNNRDKFVLTLGEKQPPRTARLIRKKREYKARLFRKKLREANQTFSAVQWEVPSAQHLMEGDLARFVHFAATDAGYDGSIESLTVNWLHPLMLAAKSLGNQADNPNWMQAMNGPFAQEYWEAACIEIETLEKMEAWEVVDRSSDMNVLPSTWAFKCKRFPDGMIKKFKARFCARGDRQIEGIDYFETYAPVVQWITVRLMLILECLLGLKSKQGDVTCAFLHAHLDKDEKVFLQMPRGFKQYNKGGREKVLSLRRSIYGLKQSPRAFWKYMVEKFEKVGMRQSDFDPCLFIGKTCIAVCYVDDILLWSTNEEHIREQALMLRDEGVDLEEEDDAAGFLGVQLTKIPGTSQMVMTQEGLITRIIEALGLDVDKSTPRNTPCLKAPLSKDLEGDPASATYSYASVVGMLLYLSGHTRPDIAYSVSQVARFTFAPKHSHECALKLIGRYLLATRDKGLVLTPSKELHVDAYPDADFAGLYGYEDSRDPICVRSRTGYVINVANCPVLWKSQLQTETATSTMMSEVIALASCCRDLMPILDLVSEIGQAVGMEQGESPKMHVRIHEDNAGALVLAETLPPQFTPASKHYAVKTHWFREQIIARGIILLKISTTEQLGDICTKCLPQATFEYLRKKLMGW